MGAILLSILSVLGTAAKATWSFVKAKALLVWTFVFVVIPNVIKMITALRALKFAAILFMYYALYDVVRTAVQTAIVAVNLDKGISWLISSAGWAGWMIWDGPLQMRILWAQFISAFSLYLSLEFVKFTFTRVEYWQGTLFGGGVGPRR